MLFKLRYKTFKGVHVDLVEARNLAEATAVGRAWCARNAPEDGRKFIQIDGVAVVADPSILAQAAASSTASSDKPSRQA